MEPKYGTVVDVKNNYYNGCLEVWVFEYEPNKQYNLTIAEDGSIVRTEMPELMDLREQKFKPYLTFPRRLGLLVLKSLYEWQERNGEKTVNQNFTEGKLQATEKHLEHSLKIIDKILKL